MAIDKDWQKQQATLDYYKENQPEMIRNKPKKLEAKIFEEIGILNMPQDKIPGYLRLYPEDFIVEEKTKGGKIIRIDAINNTIPEIDENLNTLYANMIKIGIPTTIAINRLAEKLQITSDKIGFSGLKDSDAITAQLIALPGVKLDAELLNDFKIPNVYLTNFQYSNNSLNPGDLEANVFTITVRTNEKIDDARFRLKIEMISKFGVLNFFQSQRFGGIRLISHRLGRQLLQGRYELAIKHFLFESSEEDIDLIKKIRADAEQAFPDYQKMEELYSALPYIFTSELKAVRYLKNEPSNFIGALIEIKDQTQLWVYAYSSWLFNKHLSEFSRVYGCTDEKFPIALSDNPADIKVYEKYLQEDGTMDFKKYLFPFKFMRFKSRKISGRIFPSNITYKIFDGGVVINFTLDKGSYATTMLANIFELFVSLPLPEWVTTTEIDPKGLLGQGSITEIKSILKDYYYSKQDN